MADSQFVYVIKSTADHSRKEIAHLRAGFLMRMEHNGQNRKTVSLPSNTYIALGSGIATSKDEMLIILQQVCKDTSEVHYLASVNFKTGSIERKLEFAMDESPFLIGKCSQGPILAINNHTKKQQQLYIYKVENNQLEEIPFDADAQPYTLDPYNGRIYYLDGTGISLYDVTSQQSEPTGHTLPDGAWTQVEFTEFVDGHLSISLNGPDEEDYDHVTICLATGDVFRPALEDRDRPVVIAAVTPDRYLVKLGGIPVKYQDHTPDGVPVENETVLHHFAMIAKDDYWNNRPNYQEFDNLVYENFSVT